MAEVMKRSRSPVCEYHGSVMTFGTFSHIPEFETAHKESGGCTYYCNECVDEIQEWYGARRCCDCRDGEHENYDDDLVLTTIKDPDTGKLVKRGYLCGSHRQIYDDDGYLLYTK